MGGTIMASVISASTTSGTALNMTADTTGILQLATGATPTTAVTIDASQNVGIGTTSPISGANVSLTANGSIAVSGTLSVDQTSRGIFDYNSSVNAARFLSYGAVGTVGSYIWYAGSGGVSPTERMRIDSSGNVGIGANNPTSKLSIRGGALPGAETGSPLGISSGLAATRLTTDTNNASSFIGSYYDSTTLEISQGSSSGYVSGIVVASRSSSSTVVDAVTLYTRNTERMRIDGTGNVLIPSNTLYGYQPAPTAKAAAATLTGAELIAGILSTTGTTYTITLPTGTNIDAAVSTSLAANGFFDWWVINTASGTITIGANGNTTLGSLTIATGVSAQFRFRKTAANTYTVYRLG